VVAKTVAALRMRDKSATAHDWFHRGLQLLDDVGALHDGDPTPTLPRAAVILQGPDPVCRDVASGLRLGGWSVSTSHRGPTPNTAIVVRVGRPQWAWIQSMTQQGVTHAVISPRLSSVRIGPVVTPGHTACLRCLHLARADRDREWPFLANRLERRTLPDTSGALLHEAGLLLSKMLEHRVGESPKSNDADPSDNPGSEYWEVFCDSITPKKTEVARHPLCGCWWPMVA